jgi:hypothetical protein
MKMTNLRYCCGSRDSSVGIALGYGWTIGVLSFDSRRGLGIFLFITASRTTLEPAQPLIQRVPGALSLGVKRSGREADYSHLVPRSKNAWSYTSTPPKRLHGVVLNKIKAEGQLYLYHRVQNGSGDHPASYSTGTRGSFPGSKAAGA